MARNQLCTVRGKVFGNWLVVNPQTRIRLKGNKLYHLKEGFFLIKDGIVYNFLAVKDVFKTVPL